MSDRIVLMRNGKIMQNGSAEDLYNAPESLFAARFFSQLNEIPGQVKDNRIVTSVGEFDAAGHENNANVVVAVRPQGVILTAGSSGKGVPGRIVSRRFLGEIDHFDVAVGGQESYLLSRRRTEQRLPAGTEVEVSFDPRDVLVFKADD